MLWYYTEGHLTVKVDGEEHKFSLEELISSSSTYKERRKKIQTTFTVSLLIIGGLQYAGGGLPLNKDLYFYIGYMATPVFLSAFISSLTYVYLKYIKKELSELDTMFTENSDR